jgi:hypothetical protein
MRRSTIQLVPGMLLALGCATPEPAVDASGLVRIAAKETARGPGKLYAHPTRSIDDYDDILLGDVGISYAPQEQQLTEPEMRRLRSMTYEIVNRQIPAAGQLAVAKAGPCTVTLGVNLHELEFPEPNSKDNGSARVVMEFKDSQSGEPIVRYEQQRELSVGLNNTASGPDLERVGKTLEIVAEDMRLRFRDVLPLHETGARAGQGCKGTIGKVRAQTKAKASL